MSLCQIRRYRISSALDDGRPLSRSLQNHVDGCPGCREFLNKSRTLELRLAPGDYDPPAWLSTRVMSQLHSEQPRSSRSIMQRWIPASAGLAAMLVVAVAIALNPGSEPAVEEAPPVALGNPVPPVDPTAVPESLERHAKNTLGKEFQDLAADISGARRFLGASLRSTLPGLRSN